MKCDILLISNGISGGDSGVSGGESRFMEIAKIWSKNGYKIHFLGSKAGKNLCKKMGLKVIHHLSPIKTSSNRLSVAIHSFQSFFLPKSLLKYKSGVVYSTNEQIYDVIPGLMLKLRHPNLKWGVVVHWLPPFLFWKRQQSNFLNSLLFLISERLSLYLACMFANRLMAVSDSTLEQIKKDPIARFFAHKAVSVNCGVDIKLIKKYSANAKNYDAVFMKRLQAVKGIFDLIESWKLVVKKKPKAKLIIIGTGHDENSAKDLVMKYHLQNNIEFLGAVYDFKQKFQYISQSKLFLLPTYEENWAIVIGEAMAAGTPVITYNLPELTSVWKNFATYVPKGDIRHFAKTTLSLLDNNALRKTIATEAQAFINIYDWNTIAKVEINSLLNS